MGVLDDVEYQARKIGNKVSSTVKEYADAAKSGKLGEKISGKVVGALKNAGSSIDITTPSGRQTRDLGIDRVLNLKYDAEAGKRKIRDAYRKAVRKVTR